MREYDGMVVLWQFKVCASKGPYAQSKTHLSQSDTHKLMALRYIFGSVIGAVLLFNAFTRIVLAPLDKLAEELDNEESKEDSKATEDVDDSFFIPFPGTIKSVPQSPYRGSDPEWQEYIKFNTDLALQKKAKGTNRFIFNEQPADCEQRTWPKSPDAYLQAWPIQKMLK